MAAVDSGPWRGTLALTLSHQQAVAEDSLTLTPASQQRVDGEVAVKWTTTNSGEWTSHMGAEQILVTGHWTLDLSTSSSKHFEN